MGSFTPLLPQSSDPSSPAAGDSSNRRRPLHAFLRLGTLFFSLCLLLFLLFGLVSSPDPEGKEEGGGLVAAAGRAREKLGSLLKQSAGGGREEYVTLPKLKILHLVDYETQELLMDRWLLHSHRGFASRPDLVSSAVLWGPGFPHYLPSRTLTQNIASHFGSPDHFDAVLVYFNNDQTWKLGLDVGGWFEEVAELSRAGKGVVIIDRPHEMRDQRRAPMYEHANVTLVLSPYPSELLAYRQFENRTLLVHQPHFINPEIFFHPVDKPRSQEMIIAGDLGAFYPFRRRLADLILAKKLPGWIRGHPGYADIMKPEARPAEITAESQEEQLVRFGNDLADAKMCIVTSSRWQYSVQKYTEAAAAGCLIFGNVPLDRSASFRQHLVPISNSLTDSQLVSLATYWLDPSHAKERLAKAKGMQDWVLGEFGVGKYVEQVVRMVWAAKAGQRGMVLPWEWHEEPAVWPEDG